MRSVDSREQHPQATFSPGPVDCDLMIVKRTLALAILFLVLGLSPSAFAVTVRVAGRIASSDPAPVESSGQLLLPSSFLTDRLGLRIDPGSDSSSWCLSAYGRVVTVRRDSTSFLVGSFSARAVQAPRVISGRLFVPLEIISRGFSLLWDRSGDTYDLRPIGGAVDEVREGCYNDYLRLVVDLSASAVYWSAWSAGELTVDIAPPSPLPRDWGALRLFTFTDSMQPRVKASVTDAGWTRLSITYAANTQPRLFTLGEPHRLVVDIPRTAPLVMPSPTVAARTPAVQPLPEPTLASATPWTVRNFATERGPVRVFVLKALPTSLRPALAASTLRQRSRTSSIARRENAPAAVNGGYFDWPGPALGWLVIDGEWIKHPMLSRCALAITESGQALMGRVRFSGSVQVGALGTLTLEGMNTGHQATNGTVLYTRRWGQEVPAAPGKVRLAVSSEGTITRVDLDGSYMAIPTKGYVVSASGVAADKIRAARPGMSVSINLGTLPEWPKVRHALGAGPQLVRNGQLCVTSAEESFRGDVTRISSRPAVGIDAAGNILVAAAEAEEAKGVSCTEMAQIMLKLGCRDAMALDGGGSTTVVSGGRVLNSPSDGSERPVSNALLVFGQPPS